MGFLRNNKKRKFIPITAIYFNFFYHFSLGENTRLQNTNRNVNIAEEEKGIFPESVSGNYPMYKTIKFYITIFKRGSKLSI